MAERGSMKQNEEIRALSVGDLFCGYYLLKSVQCATTVSGKPYLNLRLADSGGEVPGKFWDYDGPITAADAGQTVWVSGRVESYQNAPQVSLDNLRLTDAKDQVDLSRLVPVAPYDAQGMLNYVEGVLQQLEDADYRAVCLAVLERHREAFALLPGGKMMHHAFLHGLLMHTSRMMQQAEVLARLYPEVIDRSLLIAGAFLHDVGKLAEFTTTALGLVSDYSAPGQLLGHIYLGAQEVGAVASELDIPAEKALLLQHLIVSHHGKPEFGAVVLPKCAEAELLANIDMIDSRMEMYRTAYDDTPEGGFSRQRVYGLNNCNVYRPTGPAAAEQADT